MDTHILMKMANYGPPDGELSIQRYFWIVPLLLIPLFLIILYRILIPDLQKVKVTENIETEVLEKNNSNEEIPHDGGTQTSTEQETDNKTLEKARIKLALQLLDSDERRVVEALLDAKGSMLQKEISWKIGFSRVKTHRVLARLIKRRIVSAEKYYNTNKITLSNFLFNKNNRP